MLLMIMELLLIQRELTLEDYEQQKDPQLEKAIEEISKKINI